MAQKTNIEWTDAVWNPVTGCTKVSQGCKNCYAETVANRFWKDRKFTDVVCHEDRLEQPLHWKKPRMIFVNSMSDLFHIKVPMTFIDSVYEVMGYCQQHIFQVLTKRPELADIYYRNSNIFNAWDKWDNIWFGVSVEDNKTADERIPMLLKIPAAVRWISIEPLLEDISSSFMRWTMEMEGWIKTNEIWVVVGGESGPKARPCNIRWIKEIVNICRIQNIPVFVKQLGSKPYYENDHQIHTGVIIPFNGKGKNDKIEYFPVDLQIREYPKMKK